MPPYHSAYNSNLTYRRSHYSDTVTVNDFPQQVGSWWVYKHVYTDYGVRYYPYLDSEIVAFKIINKIIELDGAQKYLWLREPGHVIETIIVSHDTVFTQNEVLFGFKKYVFPLSVGNRWATTPYTEIWPQYVYYYDSSIVLSKSELTVANKTFGNAYLIHSDSVFVPNIHENDDRWFVPKVGIVKTNMTWFFENPHAESWELLSYDVGRRSR
jgi:hypothetical protein